jgi:transposase
MEIHVQFAVKTERYLPHEPTGKQIGRDVGLKSFYTDSDGNTVQNPRYLRQAEQHLKRLHRRVSKKQKRSKNCKKAIQRLAKGYQKRQKAASRLRVESREGVGEIERFPGLRRPSDHQDGQESSA